MDVSTVKNHIKNNELQDYYIFTGPEWEVQKLYIKHLAGRVGDIVRVDSIKDIYNQLKNNSFIKSRKCYVIRDDKELITNEDLQAQIKAGLLGDNVLVHLITNVDKRTRFYKVYKDAIVDFEPLKPKVLKKYIQAEIALSDARCEELMAICEYDYGRCLLEIDKIKRYAEHESDAPFAQDAVYWQPNDVFEILVKDGTIYKPPKDAIFDFVDSVLRRQVDKSFNLLEQSYAMGEAPLVLLTVLYNNAKALLQVQSCVKGDIGKVTGLSGWEIKNAKERAGKYKTGELVNMLKLIHEAELGIKTGRVDAEYAVEYVMVNVL